MILDNAANTHHSNNAESLQSGSGTSGVGTGLEEKSQKSTTNANGVKRKRDRKQQKTQKVLTSKVQMQDPTTP